MEDFTHPQRHIDVEKEEDEEEEKERNETEENGGGDEENGNRDESDGSDEVNIYLSGIMTSLLGIAIILFFGLMALMQRLQDAYAPIEPSILFMFLGLVMTFWGFIGTFIRRRI